MVLSNTCIFVFLFRYTDSSEVKKSSEESPSSIQQFDKSPLQLNSDDLHREINDQFANDVVKQQQVSEFVDLSIPKSISEQQLQSYTEIRMLDSFMSIL